METLQEYQKKPKKRKEWYLIASVLVHAILILLMKIQFKTENSQVTKPIELEIVEVPKKETAIQNQIVQTEEIKKSEEVADDAFLSKQTQTVDRQTKSSQNARFAKNITGGTTKKSSQSKSKALDLKSLGVKADFTPMGNLGPQNPEAPVVGATNDYLKEIKNGAQTLLNTKEFKYYAFFQRIRQQLEQYWEPGLRERMKKMFDRGREIASDKEHATMILVVLNSEGVITKVQVEATSGVFDLDQAAVDAFNKAGPFPNPPKGMIERDGTVKVEWEFVLKT